MTGVTLNFDATNVQVEDRAGAIPAGWYNVTVTSTERKPSSKKPQNSYLEVVYTVMDGQYAGRKLFNRMNLWNDDPTAMEIAYKGAAGIAALQQAVGVFNCQNTTQLHGIPLKVKVKLRAAGPGSDGKHYEASNDIAKHASINAQVDDDGAAVGVAGAPGAGSPPWAAANPAPAAAPGMPPTPAQAPPVQATMPTAAQPWEQPAAAAPAAVAQPAAAPVANGAPPWLAGATAAPAAPAPAAPAAPTAPPPEAVPAGPVMLPAAEGIPYEAWVKQGWTDEQLIAHGKMAAPTLAPPPSNEPVAAAAPQAPAGAKPPWAT